MDWYKKQIDAVIKELETSRDGISQEEATIRLKKYGPNQLDLNKDPWWKVALEPFRSVFVGVLVFAVIISLVSGKSIDAVIVGSIIIINSIIFYVQHYITSKVLRSLKKHTLSTVRVLRNGKTVSLESFLLVPGDVIQLSEGERIPADARLLSLDNFQVNESSLTGESEAVYKNLSVINEDCEVYAQTNMLFQGTHVISGAAQAIVVATGSQTEFGKIAKLTSKDSGESPVQIKINRLIAVLIKAISIVSIIVFTLSLVRGVPLAEALRFVLSLSVSAVPEGLPVTLTVILILGMRRMAKKKALVRSFKAIEDVGLITTIATDKTGTLTKNKLKIEHIWSHGNEKADYVALCTVDHHEKITDPLDLAIAEYSHITPPTHVYPFDLAIRMSGAFHALKKSLYLKGSPEHIMAVCDLTKNESIQIKEKIKEFASQGQRVIALARLSTNTAPDNLQGLSHAVFVGLLSLADELRAEAAPAIKVAKGAGIKVNLITGDHKDTAYHIARDVDITDSAEAVIEGTALPKNDKSLAQVVATKSVFARILPEDKYRILQALKKHEITAMTGDGVNDAPALANAHVGFSMGSGSDIAKDSSGIILLDDNFSTIVDAVREGRKIYDNIRRVLFYLLTNSLGKVSTMIGALLFGIPLPVTALQILWINLVTETAMAMPLGLEPEESGNMNKPPRKPSEPLLSRILLSRMIAVAGVMACTALGITLLLDKRGYELAQIQTIVFMSIVAAEWAHALTARSEHFSIFKRLRVVSKPLIAGFVIAITLQIVVMFGPLQSSFDVVSVPLSTLGFCVSAMAVLVLLTGEVHKIVVRSRAGR